MEETFRVIKIKPEYSKDKMVVSFDESMDLSKTISSMMIKQNNLWTCTVCGKQFKYKDKLGYHVEIHIEGVSHPCKYCERTYITRNSLKNHSSLSHPTYQRKSMKKSLCM